jgi:hypothetical protein
MLFVSLRNLMVKLLKGYTKSYGILKDKYVFLFGKYFYAVILLLSYWFDRVLYVYKVIQFV